MYNNEWQIVCILFLNELNWKWLGFCGALTILTGLDYHERGKGRSSLVGHKVQVIIAGQNQILLTINYFYPNTLHSVTSIVKND